LNYLDVWNDERFRERMKEREFTEADNETLSKLGI
jgi:hypothetical protein